MLKAFNHRWNLLVGFSVSGSIDEDDKYLEYDGTLLLMVQKSCITWDVENRANNGITTYQLVQDFWTINRSVPFLLLLSTIDLLAAQPQALALYKHSEAPKKQIFSNRECVRISSEILSKNMAKWRTCLFRPSRSLTQNNIEKFGHESLRNGHGSLDRMSCGKWKQLTSPRWSWESKGTLPNATPPPVRLYEETKSPLNLN